MSAGSQTRAERRSDLLAFALGCPDAASTIRGQARGDVGGKAFDESRAVTPGGSLPLRHRVHEGGAFAMDPFPAPGMEVTHILVVADVERSRAWFEDVLGAVHYRSYGGTSAVMTFGGAWLLLVTGGAPTVDKPGITFEPPPDPATVSHSFTIRVPDCSAAYERLQSRGAVFLSPPHDWGAEVRAFFRDPDGHLFEISQAGGSGS